MREAEMRHVVGLDLLRFAAALMVVALHVWGTTTLIGAADGVPGLAHAISGEYLGSVRGQASPLVFLGFVGVPVFFTISGFVIAFSSVGQSAGAFARSRALRLLPTLWFTAALGAVIWAVIGAWEPSYALRAFAHSALLLPLGPYVDGVVWTLVVEVVFYTGVGLAIALGQIKRLAWLAAALGALSCLYWLASFGGLTQPVADNALFQKVALLSLAQHGGFFAVGALVWWASATGRGKTALLMALPALTAGCLQLLATTAWSAERYAPSGAQDLGWLTCLVWLGSVAFLIASVRWNAIWRHAPEWTIYAARQMGLATYPLYLLHVPVAGLTIGLLDGPPVLILTAATVLAVLASVVTAVWIEPAIRGVMRQVVTGRVQKTALTPI